MRQPGKKTKSLTDWARVDVMNDEDIDCSDIPKLGPEFFKDARVWPGAQKPSTIRLDPDVLSFFCKRGADHQTAINWVLP
jgi:uncharacterized protein (DUF4415 family)